MSSNMAAELLQPSSFGAEFAASIWAELRIIALIVLVAVAFHSSKKQLLNGIGSKAASGSLKKPQIGIRPGPKSWQVPVPLFVSPHVEGRMSRQQQAKMLPERSKVGSRQASSASSRQLSTPKIAALKPLSEQIDMMVLCGTKRKPADALAIYLGIKANGQLNAIKDCMKTSERQPLELYSLLVQCASRIERANLIETFLDDMAEAGIERPLAFYESTMKILASKKLYKEALSVCTRLEADGLSPSAVTLSFLINWSHYELGESDQAIGFFVRLAAISTPPVPTYMTVLRIYSGRPDWVMSLALLRDMQRRKCDTDSLVLNTVLATGVASRALEASHQLLQEFALLKCTDVVSYNTVIKGFAQQKLFDRAVKLLDEMYEVGVQPNVITFNTCVDAAVRSSRVADAWSILTRMLDAGLIPDKFTCTTLMKGLQTGASADQLNLILDFLHKVTPECDACLASFLFRTVIEATAQVKDPVLTARAISQMREQQVMMTSEEYQRLLKILMQEEAVVQ